MKRTADAQKVEKIHIRLFLKLRLSSIFAKSFFVEILTVFLLAIGLSFDTFAVSVSSGVILPQIRFRQAIKIAIVLALFQGVMPIIGWAIGSGFKQYIEQIDHWVAFLILLVLGSKMIYESFSDDPDKPASNPLELKNRISIAFATSIDALIIGFGLSIIHLGIIESATIIGIVTFIVSMLGLLFGKKIGIRFGKRMEILGGIILILIGAKILFEHLGYL